MKIFITGGSGFVGSAVITAFNKKHTIFAMSRSEASDIKLKKMGATPVRCDLQNISAKHLKGCVAVIHAAAFVEEWGTPDEYYQGNVTGTSNVLNAAIGAGLKRFIHIGTEAALFKGQNMVNIDESYPPAYDSPYLYSATKAAAEKLVLDAGKSGKIHTMSVRPRLVWGPGDATILPVLLKMIRKNSFAFISGGKNLTSTTHIQNLVQAISLALTNGKSGEAYFITDDGYVTFREFLTAYLSTQGVIPPDKNVPGIVARGAAFFLEKIWRLLKIKTAPPVTRFAAAIMDSECTVNIQKARADLKYKPIHSRDKGLAQMPRLGA
jgi:nucleoside-diphosphate-sugar epimerase